MSTHHPSQVGFVPLCVAFFGCDLEKKDEEEGEFELELGEVVVVQTSGRRVRNDLLTLLSWSPSRIRPSKNELI